jgi:hypothetical protein
MQPPIFKIKQAIMADCFSMQAQLQFGCGDALPAKYESNYNRIESILVFAGNRC